MKRFSFANLFVAFCSSPMASANETSEYDSKEGCHTLSFQTSPFSGVSVKFSEGAAKFLGLNSPTDVVDFSEMEHDEIHAKFTNLFPVVNERTGSDGDAGFEIWILSADEYAAKISEETPAQATV